MLMKRTVCRHHLMVKYHFMIKFQEVFLVFSLSVLSHDYVMPSPPSLGISSGIVDLKDNLLLVSFLRGSLTLVMRYFFPRRISKSLLHLRRHFILYAGLRDMKKTTNQFQCFM